MAWSGVPRHTPETTASTLVCQRNHADHQSPFPWSAACLLDARARLLVDASLDAYDTSEYALAERLWPSCRLTRW